MHQYALIGNPVHHSKSPLIHQLFAEETHQQLIYKTILVEPNDLSAALFVFQQSGGKGLNITIPFKQEAFAFVDSVSERAKLAKAINTIKFHEDGSRFGDNTDGIGMVRDIIFNHQISIKGKRILILGAGGAVRGIIGPIAFENPAEIIIVNRTEEKAFALANEFHHLGVKSISHNEIQKEFDIVINGTSASLQNEELSLPKTIFKKESFCYDMVYGKDETPFLQFAKAQGVLRCVDGLGMLVEQAAESFFLWRNVRPNSRGVLEFLKR